LSYYGKELDENELREVANNFAVGEIIALDNENDTTNNLSNEKIQKAKEKETETQILMLENVIDLTCSFDNVENVNLENHNMNEGVGNMDFNPINLVDEILNSRN